MSEDLEKLLSNGNARMYATWTIRILEAYQLSNCKCTHYATAIEHFEKGLSVLEDRGRDLMLRVDDDPEFKNEELRELREDHGKQVEKLNKGVIEL